MHGHERLQPPIAALERPSGETHGDASETVADGLRKRTATTVREPEPLAKAPRRDRGERARGSGSSQEQQEQTSLRERRTLATEFYVGDGRACGEYIDEIAGQCLLINEGTRGRARNSYHR
jgi:hypothetical protein